MKETTNWPGDVEVTLLGTCWPDGLVMPISKVPSPASFTETVVQEKGLLNDSLKCFRCFDFFKIIFC